MPVTSLLKFLCRIQSNVVFYEGDKIEFYSDTKQFAISLTEWNFRYTQETLECGNLKSPVRIQGLV